jgi:anti-sigma factor RsiW
MIRADLELPGCEEASSKLSDFLDGELEAPAAARLVLHLAVCPECARLAIELDATIDALHQLSPRAAWPAGALN